MLRARRKLQFLASLLVLAIFVAQTSVVFASYEMFPMDANSTDHCMMKDMASDKTTTKVADCCESNDCANSYCVPGVNLSSSAIFNNVTLLHSVVFSQSIIVNPDRSPTGLAPSSLYRPPRHSA